MQNWMDFFLSFGQSMLLWLENATIFNVPLIEFLIALFLVGVILRVFLFKP